MNKAQCPQCKKFTLSMQGGCCECDNPECGWSKCDS